MSSPLGTRAQRCAKPGGACYRRRSLPPRPLSDGEAEPLRSWSVASARSGGHPPPWPSPTLRLPAPVPLKLLAGPPRRHLLPPRLPPFGCPASTARRGRREKRGRTPQRARGRGRALRPRRLAGGETCSPSPRPPPPPTVQQVTARCLRRQQLRSTSGASFSSSPSMARSASLASSASAHCGEAACDATIGGGVGVGNIAITSLTARAERPRLRAAGAEAGDTTLQAPVRTTRREPLANASAASLVAPPSPASASSRGPAIAAAIAAAVAAAAAASPRRHTAARRAGILHRLAAPLLLACGGACWHRQPM